MKKFSRILFLGLLISFCGSAFPQGNVTGVPEQLIKSLREKFPQAAIKINPRDESKLIVNAPPLIHKDIAKFMEKMLRGKIYRRMETPLERKIKKIVVTIEFKSVHIRDAIDYLAKVTGINIVLDSSVFLKEGREIADPFVTLCLSDVPFLKALQLILGTKGLSYRIESNSIRIIRGQSIIRTYSLEK